MGKYLLWMGGAVVVFVVMAVPIALLATVTHDDALYQLDLYKARHLSDVRAGQVYFVYDNELQGNPVCSLTSSVSITRIEGPKTHKFTNLIAEILPFMVELHSILKESNPPESSIDLKSASGDLEWTVIDEYIPILRPDNIKQNVAMSESIPMEMQKDCEMRIKQEFDDGKDYCIVSTVIRKVGSGVPYGVRLRQPCIFPCDDNESDGDCIEKSRSAPSNENIFIRAKSILINYSPQ